MPQERGTDMRRNRWRGWEDEEEAEFISTSAGIVFASVSGGKPTPGRLFTQPLFLHHIKETICLINAKVFNRPALFKSMHKCPHHYNRDIDLLRSPLCTVEM